MQVTVRFFAVFREAAGCASVEVETVASNTRGLFDEMCQRYEGLEHEPAALVAVNDEMSTWESQLKNGDVVLFFPPVAGG
jgi:MoaD family protein